MRQRTQVSLDDDQYRWLQRQAERGQTSVAGVVRDLVEEARRESSETASRNPFVRYLAASAPADSGSATTVKTLDSDLYG